MDLVAKPSTPVAASRWTDLHIRLVGGSLLRRTVVSVAAFTMSTCLLLGLISMAAVEATRAIVGGGDAPGDETAVVDGASDDAASPGSASSASKTSTSPRASRGTRTSRRAGGAVAPADALRASGEPSSKGDGS